MYENFILNLYNLTQDNQGKLWPKCMLIALFGIKFGICKYRKNTKIPDWK